MCALVCNDVFSGGWIMNAAEYWKIFMETGAPEAYMMYSQAKRMENSHVYDDSGVGAAGHGLQ